METSFGNFVSIRICPLFLLLLAPCAEPPPPPVNDSPIVWKRPEPLTPARDPNLDFRINKEDGSPVYYDPRQGPPPTPTPRQVRPAGDHRDSPFGSH